MGNNPLTRTTSTGIHLVRPNADLPQLQPFTRRVDKPYTAAHVEPASSARVVRVIIVAGLGEVQCLLQVLGCCRVHCTSATCPAIRR
jgi:hypothetical protein